MTQDDIDHRIQVGNLLIVKAGEDRNQILSGQLRGDNLLKHLEQLVRDYDGYNLTYKYLYALCGLKFGDNHSRQEVPRDDAHYGPTEFAAMVSTIKMLNLSKDDVFYDLGSGRGIFINLIGLITNCQVRGIEVDTARVADSRKLSR